MIFNNKWISLGLALLVLGSLGCKKGPNDPGISIISRKGRVAGLWGVSTASGTTTVGNAKETWEYTDPTMSTTADGVTKTKDVDITYDFEKSGSFTRTETVVETGRIEEKIIKGEWDFAGGVGDYKRRSRIVLVYKSYEENVTVGGSPSSSSHTYSGNNAPVLVYDLDRLASDEMIWKYSGTTTVDGVTTASYIEEEWNLKQ